MPRGLAELEQLWATASPAVRLQMHGEIRLRQWLPFRAEEVLTAAGEMVWAAQTKLYGLPVRGADCLLKGKGSMDWRIFGIFPVMRAEGEDITRSARGRMEGELAFFLPPPGQSCPRTIRYPRWGNPDGKGWRDVDFGGVVEEVGRFAGREVPVRFRIGWHFDGKDFENNGEFFRAEVTAVEYR